MATGRSRDSSQSSMTNSYTESEREIESESELKAGDIVEFPRGGGAYRHVGIAMGDGKGIVHKTGDAGTAMKRLFNDHTTRIASVQVDPFKDVKGDGKAFRNNTKDKTESHRKRDKVVEKAVSQIGPVKYNPNTANCQHFANDCRYKNPVSDQNVGTALGNKLKQKKYKEDAPKKGK